MARWRRIVAIISQLAAGIFSTLIVGGISFRILGLFLGTPRGEFVPYSGKLIPDILRWLWVFSVELIDIFVLFPLVSGFCVDMAARFWSVIGSRRQALIGAWLGSLIAFVSWLATFLLARLLAILNVRDDVVDILIYLIAFEMLVPCTVVSMIAYWRSVSQPTPTPEPWASTSMSP